MHLGMLSKLEQTTIAGKLYYLFEPRTEAHNSLRPAANRTGGRLTGQFGTGTGWNRNRTEPEPSEPDFGVYIGTKKLNFGLEDTNKYFEDSYGCSFFRGIRWC